MWYANSYPGHQYVLEEIVANSRGSFPIWHQPVCASCQMDNSHHQYVLDEIAAYDQPGMAGLGFFGALAALAGRQGRKSRVKRLRPVIAKGRVFAPPAGAQGQVVGYGSGGGGDAMQAVAEQEIANTAASQARWQRPITQAPQGLERLLATGATIGAGMGKEAYDAREQARFEKKNPYGVTNNRPTTRQESEQAKAAMGLTSKVVQANEKAQKAQIAQGAQWGRDAEGKPVLLPPGAGRPAPAARPDDAFAAEQRRKFLEAQKTPLKIPGWD